MIYNEISTVIYNEEIAENIFEAHLTSKDISKATSPGQFINILPSMDFPYVMRRPMSVSYQDDNSLKIIYKAIGDGTKIMKNWRKGDEVDILGPLGNHWDVSSPKDALLLGGGVGVAPILNLFNSINGTRKTSLFIGSRDKKEHFLSHKPSENIFLSTDNGSLGIKGNLFEAINLVFSIEELQSKTMYVCGPPMMMETLHKFSLENNIECYLALETVMACGIGICQGCTLEINVTSKTEHSYRNQYELVCMDGPIYNAKKVKTCLL